MYQIKQFAICEEMLTDRKCIVFSYNLQIKTFCNTEIKPNMY